MKIALLVATSSYFVPGDWVWIGLIILEVLMGVGLVWLMGRLNLAQANLESEKRDTLLLIRESTGQLRVLNRSLAQLDRQLDALPNSMFGSWKGRIVLQVLRSIFRAPQH